MKKLILYLFISMLILSINGCDDDSNDLTPPIGPESPRTLVTGAIILRPYVDFLCYMTPIYGQELEIDSVKLDDTLCKIGKSYRYAYGNNYQHHAVYFNPDDFNNYNSGDFAEFIFYEGNTPASVSLKLLNLEEDKPTYVESLVDTIFDVGAEINLTWNKKEKADWYGIWMIRVTGSGHDRVHSDFYAYTTDTIFSVPTSQHMIDCSYTILVVSTTGPQPGAYSYNLQGRTILGSIYSYSDGARVDMIIGDGAGYGIDKQNPEYVKPSKLPVSYETIVSKLIENLK